VVFLPYALVGIPALILIGLATILPLILLGVLLSNPRGLRKRQDHAIVCLTLAILLSAVYLSGWFFYTWPTPYQPVQTISIVLVTILAYENWLHTTH
jgi:hypothetical protein